MKLTNEDTKQTHVVGAKHEKVHVTKLPLLGYVVGARFYVAYTMCNSHSKILILFLLFASNQSKSKAIKDYLHNSAESLPNYYRLSKHGTYQNPHDNSC